MEGGHIAAALLVTLLLFGLCSETSAAAAGADGGGQQQQEKEKKKESSGGAPVASTEFIRVHCGTTSYPRLCVNSLSAYATTIKTSPNQLADAALSVTLTSARSTSALVSNLSAAGRSGSKMKPREAAAVKDCMETMRDSVDELRDSLRAMGNLTTNRKGQQKTKATREAVALQLDNIQTWVSAALTDEDTCIDEFAGKAMDGRVKAAVRGHISRVARLTSNALALINGLSSTITHP